MKVVSIVGARPQFVKLGPVAEAMTEAGVEHVIVHTGQHYDLNMSDVFFEGLRIPVPDVNLGVGSASQGVQTGEMLAAMDPILEAEEPDWVLVYGDTNSTLAGALSAVKMHLPVAHLEAGLRSFNRLMPEEHNRVLTDHAADLLLVPTEIAMGHLRNEGLGIRSVLVGDVMADVCLRVARSVTDAPLAIEDVTCRPGDFYLATLHRAENTDDADRLAQIIAGLQSLDRDVLLLVHPRLAARADAQGLNLERGSLRTLAPTDYSTMVRLVMSARKVLTDSGGLQKEAYLLGTPCVTLRTETEWVETLDQGWNVLCPDPERIQSLAAQDLPISSRRNLYGDGQAGARVVQELLSRV